MPQPKAHKLSLTIESISDSMISCCAENELGKVCFDYYFEEQRFDFTTENTLTEIICEQQFQFHKVLKSAAGKKLHTGQKISCVFIPDFRFLSDTDYNNYIRLDRRNGLKITISTEETQGLCKIFTDGAFLPETMTSGYGGVIKDTTGREEIYCESFPGGASNQMELLAVLDGLKRLTSEPKIQINTDSRYVIRGITQWMHFWLHNNWQTAFGTEVKYVDDWKQINELTEGKFIEFKWIKGHSGHLEQDFCHQLAQDSAKAQSE